jgi:p21-activated kinase 1
MSQNLPSQLRRYPSASQSPTDSTESRGHHRTLSSHTSNSVDELSENSKFSSQPPSVGHPSRHRKSASQSLNEKSSDEVIGALSGLSTVDSTKASDYQNSLRRPGPPTPSHTTPNARMMSPSLRQSASFSIGDRTSDTTPPPPGSGLSTPKRYSDEARNSAPWKKKSSFSTFMTSVLGSPRNFKISNPENPVHVTHVGFDNETGQFTVSRLRSDQFTT